LTSKDSKPCCWWNNKAVFPIIFFCIYLFLDYINIGGKIGIEVSKINSELFGSLLNAAIVVTLYIATYYIVDRRQIKKEENASYVVDVLLYHTYTDCIGNLGLVNNKEFVQKYIVPKVDFNKPINHDSVVKNLQNSPFSTRNEIIDLAKSGLVEEDVFDKYIAIERNYKNLVGMKITLFDLHEPQTSEQKELYDGMIRRETSVTTLLEEELKRLVKG